MKTICTLILSVFITHCTAQPFQITLSFDDNGRIPDFVEIEHNNTYAAIINNYNSSNSQTDSQILIFDYSGAIIDTVRVNTYESNVFSKILLHNDTLYVVGYTDDDSSSDLTVHTFDADFNLLLHRYLKKLDNHPYIYPVSAHFFSGNKLRITGATKVSETYIYESPYIYEISSSLDSINSVFFYSNETIFTYSSIFFEKANITLLSITYPLGVPSVQLWEIDENLITTDTLEIPGFSHESGLKAYTDSTFLLASNYHTADYEDIGIAIISDTYEILTNRHVYSSRNMQFATPNMIDFYDPNSIFLAGTPSLGMPTDTKHFQLVQLDSNLEIKWEYFYETEFEQSFLHNIKATSDKGCLLGVTSYQEGKYAGYIIKVDSLGNYPALSRKDAPYRFTELLTYPNPGTTQLNIRTAVQAVGGTFNLSDLQGRLVLSEKISDTHSHINTSGLAPGSYIYQYVLKGELRESGKWIKN